MVLLKNLLLLPLLLVMVNSCSHHEVNPDDPEALYSYADEQLKDGRYILAIEKFRDIKNRFPYSKRAVDAELRIADAYFEQESYLEAESAYEIFRELHPAHPKSDYVQFRIGMSYFELIPSNSARDLSAAHRSVDAFELLLERYPKSEYAAQARSRIIDARRRLAEHENYVADFYFHRRHYLSATYRYSALLERYPSLGYDEQAMYRLAECYFNTRMFSKARQAIEKLQHSYPNSRYASAAGELLTQINKATR